MFSSDSTDPRIARSRSAVLDAALQLLGERGFAGLSIDGISKLSGVARTTIYRHWHSLAEIIYEAANEAAPPHPGTLESNDVLADIRSLVQRLANALTTSAWGHIFPSLIDASARDDEIYAMQTRHSQQRRAVLASLVIRAQDEGLLDPAGDPEFIAELLTAPLFSRMFVSHLPVDEAFVDQLVDYVIAVNSPAS